MRRSSMSLLGIAAAMIVVIAAQALRAPSLARAEEKSSIVINGAGASFPYPVYSKWAFKYESITGVKLNYQSIGSGGGISQIKAKTVDFGASDAPLQQKELTDSGLVQFPMIVGGVVPVLNCKGIAANQMKLTPELLADIFIGKVATWDDKAIKDVNPDLAFPSMPITVVHRSDASGTTWIFTNYLSKVSRAWKEKVGADKAVAWPAGVGAKGNEGVAAYVQRVDGSIGYVEYAYALQNKMVTAQMKNSTGKFVTPAIKAFQVAAANADWKNAPGYYMVLVDQPGDESWPITGASFILVHKEQPDAAHARAMLAFFDWSFRHGADIATELDYVPLPANVYEMVEETWLKDVTASGKPVWQK